MNRINRSSSAHSVRVPLSVVASPQYGGRTIWDARGLRLADFQGDIIAADRDAPPGLQVRFSDDGSWLPLGPGEVLWAPRRYTEVHARIFRAGAAVPANSTQRALALRGGAGGAELLSPLYPDRYALLATLGFNLYNEPIQAFPGPRQGNPGGLFFKASDLNTTATAVTFLLGNWFSPAELNEAGYLLFEYELLAADVAADYFLRAPVSAATYAPYITVAVRDPLSAQQQTLRVGACETYTGVDGGAGTLSEHGVLKGRFAFQGPFAPWQQLDLTDVFNSPGGVRLMGTTQGTWSNLCRISLLPRGERRPLAFAQLTGGRVATATPFDQALPWCSLRHQIAGFDETGPRQMGELSWAMQTLAGALTFLSHFDPARISSTAYTRLRVSDVAGANANYYRFRECFEGVLALHVGGSAGVNSITAPYVPPCLRLSEY